MLLKSKEDLAELSESELLSYIDQLIARKLELIELSESVAFDSNEARKESEDITNHLKIVLQERLPDHLK